MMGFAHHQLNSITGNERFKADQTQSTKSQPKESISMFFNVPKIYWIEWSYAKWTQLPNAKQPETAFDFDQSVFEPSFFFVQHVITALLKTMVNWHDKFRENKNESPNSKRFTIFLLLNVAL